MSGRLSPERESEIRRDCGYLGSIEGDCADCGVALCAVDDLLAELNAVRAEADTLREALGAANEAMWRAEDAVLRLRKKPYAGIHDEALCCIYVDLDRAGQAIDSALASGVAR